MNNINLKEYNLFNNKIVSRMNLFIILTFFLVFLIFVFKIEFYNNKKILLEKIDNFKYELNIPINSLKYLGNRTKLIINKKEFTYKIVTIDKENYFYDNTYYKKIVIILNKKTSYQKNYIVDATTYEKESIVSNILKKMKGE